MQEMQAALGPVPQRHGGGGGVQGRPSLASLRVAPPVPVCTKPIQALGCIS